MLNEELLLDAMQGIRLENVKKAESFLGYAEDATPPFRVHRKLWSTLLVAAIIVSLFTVTAYALGWFQMSHHGSRETYTATIGEQQVEWKGEYAFEFEGPEECPEVRFHVDWAPSDDYWYPASWATGWTELVEGRELYNEEFGVYMPSCVVDILYAPQFVDGGAMILIGFKPGEITRETWGDVEVYKFQATATHAIDREQTEFPTGNFVILFHPEEGWIIGVRGYDSMENIEGIARGLTVEPTGRTIHKKDFDSKYDFCDIYIG